MNVTQQVLLEQIIDEVQTLPDNLIREVLDFIGYLRAKYDPEGNTVQEKALLATFGSWEDDRTPEDIIQDIYATRTISDLESGL